MFKAAVPVTQRSLSGDHRHRHPVHSPLSHSDSRPSTTIRSRHFRWNSRTHRKWDIDGRLKQGTVKQKNVSNQIKNKNKQYKWLMCTIILEIIMNNETGSKFTVKPWPCFAGGISRWITVENAYTPTKQHCYVSRSRPTENGFVWTLSYWTVQSGLISGLKFLTAYTNSICTFIGMKTVVMLDWYKSLTGRPPMRSLAAMTLLFKEYLIGCLVFPLAVNRRVFLNTLSIIVTFWLWESEIYVRNHNSFLLKGH